MNTLRTKTEEIRINYDAGTKNLTPHDGETLRFKNMRAVRTCMDRKDTKNIQLIELLDNELYKPSIDGRLNIVKGARK